jgi:hemoglobin
MKPIETKEDLTFLIDTFYGKVLKDEMLAPFFKHFDMAAHMPKMVQFWSFALLDEHGYKGNVIEKHLHMPLKKEHFDRWVELFEGTMDEHFEGEKVVQAKQKIAVLRWTMESKINAAANLGGEN